MRRSKSFKRSSDDRRRERTKRLNCRAAYRQTSAVQLAVLIVVAAISVLVATLWMPHYADLWFFHVTDSGAGADRNLSKEQTSENRRYCCILAGQQASGQTCDRRHSGQWVDIDAGGVVTVDGQTLDEPYLKEVSGTVILSFRIRWQNHTGFYGGQQSYVGRFKNCVHRRCP